MILEIFFNSLVSIQSVLAKSKLLIIDPSQSIILPNLSYDVPSVSIAFHQIVKPYYLCAKIISSPLSVTLFSNLKFNSIYHKKIKLAVANDI